MNRILLAFRCFVAILFRGRVSEEAAEALGLSTTVAQPAPKTPAADLYVEGAVRMLAILQRDARLVDFVLEDISSYSDEQIGAAVRSIHDDCAKSLAQYVKLDSVIDGLEGDVIRVEDSDLFVAEAAAVKFLGNLPAQGRPKEGVLRHRGWRALKVDLPDPARRPMMIIAPAEIEVE